MNLPLGLALTAFIGNIDYYKTIEPNLVGLFMVPGN